MSSYLIERLCPIAQALELATTGLAALILVESNANREDRGAVHIRRRRFRGTAKHLHRDDHDEFAVIAMSVEALATSAIAGEILDRASVQSSIRQELAEPHSRRLLPRSWRSAARTPTRSIQMLKLDSNGDVVTAERTRRR